MTHSVIGNLFKNPGTRKTQLSFGLSYSLSACILHAHGVCAHSEILRWENFDGGIEGDSQNENALFIVPRVFGILVW